MIRFHLAPDWFKLAGLRVFSFQLFIFIFCLPLFHFGTWIQVEPTMFSNYLAGILVSLWFFLGIIKKWLRVELPISALVYVLFAWGLWQIITTVTAINPLINWMGPPELGEGGAYHVILVLTSFLAMVLWGEENYRKRIITTATASVAIMAFLHFDSRMINDPMAGTKDAYNFYHGQNPWAPSNWPHYLAFIISWVWIAYFSAPSLRTRIRDVAAVLLFVAVLLVSHNKSAYILLFPLFFGGLAVIGVQKFLKHPRDNVVSKNWKMLALVGVIVPLGWIVGSQYYNLKEASFDYSNVNNTIAQCKPEYQWMCKIISVTERAGFNQVTLAALKDNPSSLLLGRGWGSWANDLFAYNMVDGLHSYKDGVFAPNYMNLYGFVDNNYDFHPHNQPLSVLHALGLIGFILFMLIPIIAIWQMQGKFFWLTVPVLLGMTAVSGVWFIVPQVLAFNALGLAALCSMRVVGAENVTRPIARGFAVLSLVIGVMLTGAAIEQAKGIIYGVTFYQLKFAKETPVPPNDIEWMTSDIARGGDRLLFYAISYVEEVAKKIEEGTITVNDRDWYRLFLEAARETGTREGSDAFLRILEPHLSQLLLYDFKQPSPLDDLKPEVRKSIVASVLRFTESAPKREDFIAPFLVNISEISGGDSNKERELLEQLLAINPQHRSALWLLGGIYESIPEQKEKGVATKKQAVKLGVAKVYPVSDTKIAAYSH